MTSLKAFWHLARQFPRLLWICAALLSIDAVFALINIATVAPLADLLLERPESDWLGVTITIKGLLSWIGLPFSISTVAGLILVSMTGMAIVSVVVRWYSLHIRSEVIRHLTTETFDHLFSAGWNHISKINRGQLINTFLNEIRLTGNSFLLLANCTVIIVRVVAFAVIPLLVAPLLVLGCLLACGLVILPFLSMGRWSYRLGKHSVREADRYTNLVKESIDGAREIAGFGRARETINKIKEVHARLFAMTTKGQTLGYAASQFYEPVGLLAILMVILLLGSNMTISLSQIGVVLWSLIRIIPPFKEFINLKHNLDNNLPRYEQIRDIQAAAKREKIKDGTREITDIVSNICLNSVSYVYDVEKVISNVNMEFPRGSIVAIVGESGSGKSTVADLIMGLLSPLEGSVQVDGIDLSEYRLDSWRGIIGLVPQNPILFDLSIRENLEWSNPAASEEEIRHACHQAGASGFISKLSHEMDTEIGDLGTRLSGGQAQRIAIARALVRKPKLLLFDEATSALDSENEASIFDGLYKLADSPTLIVIAHRLSTIAKADNIYVMKDGTVVEQGVYSGLKNSNGYFSRMIEAQNL